MRKGVAGKLAGFARRTKRNEEETEENEGEEFKGEGKATPSLHSPSPEEPTVAGFRGCRRDGVLGREADGLN